MEKVMFYDGNIVRDLKIAYIGGGSRGWAWGLMSDLARCDDMNGVVDLYDIDFEAAKNNEIIGNRYNDAEGAASRWDYRAVDTLCEALTGAQFVVISILPATFKEMESDVHTPEKYGIYQPVGDTTGPGGIVRAMRAVPMFEEIGKAIKECCPDAWVINYTNPMTLCVRALYRVFPEIKAFGCCHEVFGTQELLQSVLEKECGIKAATRMDIKVNPIGVNHFTWLTKATYRDEDLFPIYRDYARKMLDGTASGGERTYGNSLNNCFASEDLVKMDLFLRFGFIAAAGDRHLAEFCPGKWYLESPERVAEMRFALTPVSWRLKDLDERLDRSRRLLEGEPIKLYNSGEDGVQQIRSLLGLREMVTNVNIPNRGQIPNLPMDAVVETNAVFTSDSIVPVMAGEIPASIYPLISRVCGVQETVSEGIAERDLEKIFRGFADDPLVTCGIDDARRLFAQMCENTKEYLKDYPIREPSV